jgi:hypothetical protein
MAQHVGKHHWDVLTPNLCLIINSPSLHDLSAQLKTFLAYWAHTCPAYAEYFRSMWRNHWPPQVWAAFGWKELEGIPSGDHCLEGWHNRLQNHIWPQDREAADHAITYLNQEWEASFVSQILYLLQQGRRSRKGVPTGGGSRQPHCLPMPLLHCPCSLRRQGPHLPLSHWLMRRWAWNPTPPHRKKP